MERREGPAIDPYTSTDFSTTICCGCTIPDHTKNLSIHALIMLSLLASLSSLMSGYCLGVTSVAVIFIKKELHLQEMQEQALVASLVLVSMLGNVFAGRLADTIGRKKTMAMAAVISFMGSLLMALSPSFGVLMVGRLVTGISVGMFFVVGPLYIAEICPSEVRGMLISLPEIFLNVGVLLGYMAGFLLAELPACINWRIMFFLGVIPAIMIAINAICWMPESPRWLALIDNRVDPPSVALQKIGGRDEKGEGAAVGSSDDPRGRGESRSSSSSSSSSSPASSTNEHNPLLRGEDELLRTHSSNSAFHELLCAPTRPMRRAIAIAIAFQFFNQASGVAAILYYAPTIFHNANLSNDHAGSSALKANVLVGISKTLFILIATMQVDRTGRRTLLIISGLGMSVSMAVLATSFLLIQKPSFLIDHHLHSHNNNPTISGGCGGCSSRHAGVVAVTATCCYVAFFSIGFGPINNLVLSELFPVRVRAVGMGLCMVVNRTLSGIISLFFLTISAAASPAGTFFAFSMVSAMSMVFVYFFIPETRGKELETTFHATHENPEA